MSLGKIYLNELKSEVQATRKCIERIPIDKLYDWKPHEKSMKMGYLTVLIAEMPRWISHMINVGDIDLKTWKSTDAKTAKELVAYYDKCVNDAEKALEKATDEDLEKDFSLKSGEQVLFTQPKKDVISSSINHWVHHRGQLTVYMRLNDIPVPAIYGSSADEKGF